MFALLNYVDEKNSRDQFYLNNKISKLFQEQRQIFNIMPDGILIHQSQRDEDADIENQTSTSSLVKYFN